MNALQLDGVRRTYWNGTEALRGVDLAIRPGEVVGLLGRNGAGKSTCLRIAMGMIHPQRGTARLFGLDPWTQAVEAKRRVGYVAEDQILPGSLRVDELMDLHRSLFPTWDDALAARLAARFELRSGDRIRTLSKGKARAAALVCAVAHRPELLLLDEPAGGLDPVARREFLATTLELLRETDAAILFSTHQMADVERLASRVVVLDEGRVLVDADLDRLREGYSLAVLASNGFDEAALRGIEGFRGARRRDREVHALFQLAPELAGAQLRERLGVADAECRRLPLEELFIELVETRR